MRLRAPSRCARGHLFPEDGPAARGNHKSDQIKMRDSDWFTLWLRQSPLAGAVARDSCCFTFALDRPRIAHTQQSPQSQISNRTHYTPVGGIVRIARTHHAPQPQTLTPLLALHVPLDRASPGGDLDALPEGHVPGDIVFAAERARDL